MNKYSRKRLRKMRFHAIRALGVSFLLLSATICWAETSSGTPFLKGETITYNIKKLRLNVGEATLVFNGEVNLYGKKVLLVTMTAKGFRFFDNEEIYLDAETFHPVMIKRDLNIFGVKEEINEFYDAKSGRVKIVKVAKGKKSEQIIENGKRFDNIYGFIYRYRLYGQFNEGREFYLHLPTRDVSFKLVKKDKFEAAGQEFEAYYMDSMPAKYKVWFDSSSKKIPLMIDGAIGFGHTSMVMKDYAARALHAISR